MAERVDVVLDLTSRLNVLRHSDVEARTLLLGEILGHPVPETLTLNPPFYCDHGLNIDFGKHVFVNQNCAFYDLGGITIGDRTMVGPRVTLCTAGYPVAPANRFDGVTAPIEIGQNMWIGANVTVAPGVSIGSGSVIAAGAVIAKDAPAGCPVSGPGYVTRRDVSSSS